MMRIFFQPEKKKFYKNRGRKTIIENDRVIKICSPGQISQEIVKTEKAHKIGLETGLFRVPIILDADERKSIIIFERIKCLQSVRSLSVSGLHLMKKIGISLAYIHHKLKLDNDLIVNLPTFLAYDAREVFIHGDYSIDNVCVNTSNGEIIIIDWQMTDLHGGNATFGTCYFDVLWFINNLFFFPIKQITHFTRAKKRADSFLQGYTESQECPINMNELADYMRRTMKYKFKLRRKKWNWRQKLLYEPSHYWLMHYILSIK